MRRGVEAAHPKTALRNRLRSLHFLVAKGSALDGARHGQSLDLTVGRYDLVVVVESHLRD